MTADLECVAGDLRIKIDPTLCVAFGECVTIAPAAFQLNDDGIVVFVEPRRVERGKLIAACAACPVDALMVWDTAGTQLVPKGAPHVP